MEITVNLLKALRDIVSASDAATFECGPHFDHFGLLDALIIERQSMASNWRPIEIAPRDGTYILAIHNRGTWISKKDPIKINYIIVCWCGSRWEQFGPGSFDTKELTHWMPLPEPPGV